MSGAATETPDSQKTTQDRPRDWDGRTRTGLGILIFYWAFTKLGPRFAYLLLFPVALYHVVFDRKHRRASRDYLRRRFPGLRGLKLWWMCYRHFLSFGRVLVDRGYAFLGMLGEVKLERDGHEVIEKALGLGKGVILVSAHVGNWELAAYCLGGYRRDGRTVPVNAVMFRGESERVEKQLKRVSGEPPFRVIASNDALQAGIECKQALDRGEIVAIHGDRNVGTGGVRVPFLGGKARLPAGPYLLAAGTGAPLVFTFANRVGTRHYRLRARGPFTVTLGARKDRQRGLEEWAGRYAAELEEVLTEYPLQWHNFHPFWEKDEPR